MSHIKKKFLWAYLAVIISQLFATAVSATELMPPVLSVSPREINLGTIIPGEAGAGLFTLRNMGAGSLEWSVKCPEGWQVTSGAELLTVMLKKSDYLRVEVRLLTDEEQSALSGRADGDRFVEMKLEGESQSFTVSKKLSEGMHKEAIRINSAGGDRTIFVSFVISLLQQKAMLNLNPARIDMGAVLPNKTVSKRITLTNKGREMLNWSVAVEKPKRKENPADFKKSVYLSFLNDDSVGKGVYEAPAHLRDIMELSGRWTENNGYPSGAEGENAIRMQFVGTGIILYVASFPAGAVFHVYIDERPVDIRGVLEELHDKNKGEKGEITLAEGLADGPHVLTIVSKDSRLIFEGVKILGKSVSRAPAGKTTVVPTSGTTLTQTNYLRVTFNSSGLQPGYYSDNIVFNANGGEVVVELFAEVVSESAARDIDVYRYSRGDDFLLTANPQEDTAKFGRNNYTKDGIAFRLFAPNSPGTTPFYRWYSIQRGDHFYHHDQNAGGKNLQGYMFEGAIGNIATSKLTNTRELYRWHNAATGRYFFTTDARAVNIRKRGYSFDGIAGYVK